MISWPPHTIWLDTPKGEMRVLFVQAMGPDGDHEWTCVNDYGEVWTFLNYAVLVVKNVTYEIEARDDHHRKR